jgi:DNA-binding transcriptional ArsR family regulator
MPIFRSTHQAELLTALLLHPDRDYSVTELANRLDVPLTTLHREIDRLEAAGLIKSRPVGRSRLLSANTANRLVPALTELLLATYGPVPVITEEFGNLGATRVLLFGSWAARYHGEPGPPPNDVDVLLIGPVQRANAYEAARRAENRLGYPVNPTIMSDDRWSLAADPLTRTIQSSPVVDLVHAAAGVSP